MQIGCPFTGETSHVNEHNALGDGILAVRRDKLMIHMINCWFHWMLTCGSTMSQLKYE